VQLSGGAADQGRPTAPVARYAHAGLTLYQSAAGAIVTQPCAT